MDSGAKKYLETEREISSFKLESIRKMISKADASTKRLAAIEEEFLSIPFDRISNTLPELLSAIKIFRDSRQAFYEMYPVPTDDSTATDNRTISFIYSELKKEIISYSKKSSISKAKDSRMTGRVLTILLSILVYLEKSEKQVRQLSIEIDEKDLILELIKIYDRDIFSFYNDIITASSGFDFLPEEVKNSISSVKPLVCVESIDDNFSFTIDVERAKGRNIFGFFLPIKHTGRETLRPYHLHLIDEDGFNISKLFIPQARSILSENKNEYYKFVSIISIDDISDNAVLFEKYQVLMKKIFHNKLSGKCGVRLDCKDSSVLVPSSRTEDEGIKEAFSIASAIFSNILNNIV
jgi:hypothetical protein